MVIHKTCTWFFLIRIIGWFTVLLSFVLIRETEKDSIDPMVVTSVNTRVSLKRNDHESELQQPSKESRQSSKVSQQSLKDSSVKHKGIETTIVERLLNGYGPEKEYYIFHTPRTTVGFTNVFRSLVGSIVIAIATGRRLRTNWEELFNVTDSSFKRLLISSNETIPTPGMIISDVRPLLRTYKQCSLSKLLNHSVIQVRTGFDIGLFALRRPVYDEVLKKAGLLSLNNDPRFLLYRLLLHPNEELGNVIQAFQRKNNLSQCVTVQLRIGGDSANSKETKTFLKMETVEEALQGINMKYDNRPIFLSTDSPTMVPRVRDLLKNHVVVTADAYEVGHTRDQSGTGHKHQQYLKRAIVDALIASQCNPLYTTYDSSYGKMIYWLSNKSIRYLIRDKLNAASDTIVLY